MDLTFLIDLNKWGNFASSFVRLFVRKPHQDFGNQSSSTRKTFINLFQVFISCRSNRAAQRVPRGSPLPRVPSGTRGTAAAGVPQVELHERFGGVVPEVAARAHVEAIRPLAHQAITRAGIHPNDLDAVAVTRGPGLVGALMVGFAYAKSLAYSLELPLYGIDHMEGHLYAPRLAFDGYEPPAVVILASGGHSQIVHVKAWGEYEVLGGTIDELRLTRGTLRSDAWVLAEYLSGTGQLVSVGPVELAPIGR